MMRSIPQALVWEMWRRGWWYMLGGLLAANLMPALLFTALQFHGAIDPEHTSFLVMHVVLVLINGFVFAAMVFSAMGDMRRLYAMPASTPTLVTWHLLPIMVLVLAESAASSAVLNAEFGLGWPVWGPAFFVTVMVAAVAALHWVTEHSGWELVAMMIVPLALGLWFKSRYGETFSMPELFWRQVTPVEGGTMTVIALLAYAAAVYGVSRNRRGEPLPSPGVLAWLERTFDPAPYRGGRFRSSAAAQFWFEWRKKGMVMPAATVMGLVVGLVIWLVANRDLNALLEGLLAGGGLLSVAALVGGLMMGNCGSTDQDFSMASFQATRPITDTQMARAFLKTGVRSVALGWLIWVAAIALFFVLHTIAGVPAPPWPKSLGWWYFPAVLVGAWATLSFLTSLGLTGHSRLAIYLFCGSLGILSVMMTAVKLTLSLEQQRTFWHVAITLTSLAVTFASACAFWAARRRQLIGWATVYVAASIWLALSSLVALANVFHARERYALFAALSAACALAVVPLATMPLAVTHNRHR